MMNKSTYKELVFAFSVITLMTTMTLINTFAIKDRLRDLMETQTTIMEYQLKLIKSMSKTISIINESNQDG